MTFKYRQLCLLKGKPQVQLQIAFFFRSEQRLQCFFAAQRPAPDKFFQLILLIIKNMRLNLDKNKPITITPQAKGKEKSIEEEVLE